MSDALACVVLLDRVPPSRALKTLLDVRLAALESTLAELDADDVPAATLSAGLTRAATHVEQTLWHLDALFFNEAQRESWLTSHLAQLTLSSPGASAVDDERSFLTGLYPPRTNLHLLSRHMPVSIWKYVPYVPQDAGDDDATHAANQAAVLAFLEDAKRAADRLAAAALARCTSSSTLADVRDTTWSAVACTNASVDESYAWDDMCARVAGRAVGLWDTLLRDAFKAATNTVVRAAYERIPALVGDALEERLAGDAFTVDAPPEPTQRASASVLAVLDRIGAEFVAAKDTVDALAHANSLTSAGASPEAVQNFRDDLAGISVVQAEQVAACALQVSSVLSGALDTVLKAEVADEQTDLTAVPLNIARALYVGRVAVALAEAPATTGARTAASPTAAVLFEAVAGAAAELRKVSATASDALVAALTTRFSAAVDQALLSSATVAERGARVGALEGSWQLSALSDASARSPAQLSAPLASCLMQACTALQSAGGHSLDRSVARRLAAGLLSQLVKSFASLADGPFGSQQPTDGRPLLQLAFDARVLLKVLLAPGEEYDAAAKSLRTAVSRIESRVDPIDLAVFTDHVDEKVDCWVSRSQTLLGALAAVPAIAVSDAGRRSGAAQPAAIEQHNIMAVAPAAKRIALLPIGDAMFISTGPIEAVEAAPNAAVDKQRQGQRRTRAPIKVSLEGRASRQESAAATPTAAQSPSIAPHAAASKVANHFFSTVNMFLSGAADPANGDMQHQHHHIDLW